MTQSKSQKRLYTFRYDIDIPMLLDYEIWKSSHMLFQKFPYNEDENLENEEDIEREENE